MAKEWTIDQSNLYQRRYGSQPKGIQDFLAKSNIRQFPAIVFVERADNGQQKIVTQISRSINNNKK